MTTAAKAALATVLMLAGCQSYVDADGRTHLTAGLLLQQQGPPQGAAGPGHAFVPNAAIFAGVQSFNGVYARDGMAGVQAIVAGCRNSAARGINRADIPQCFAFDVAAMIVAVSHDRVHRMPPMDNLDVPSFRRRFALYQDAMGVPPDVRKQVEDSVFSRDSAVMSARAS